jgi:hypothetical protein
MRNDGEESLAIFSVRMIIFVNVLTTENEVATKLELLNITSTSSLDEVNCHASNLFRAQPKYRERCGT